MTPTIKPVTENPYYRKGEDYVCNGFDFGERLVIVSIISSVSLIISFLVYCMFGYVFALVIIILSMLILCISAICFMVGLQ